MHGLPSLSFVASRQETPNYLTSQALLIVGPLLATAHLISRDTFPRNLIMRDLPPLILTSFVFFRVSGGTGSAESETGEAGGRKDDAEARQRQVGGEGEWFVFEKSPKIAKWCVRAGMV